MQKYKITPIMLRTIEMILNKRNRAEIGIENGRIVIVEVKRKRWESGEIQIPDTTEYQRR